MRIIEDLFNIVAPHECLGCKKEGRLLCDLCLKQVDHIPPRCYLCKRWSDGFRTCERCRLRSPLSYVISMTTYEGISKELIRMLKFARVKAGAQVIADALISQGFIPEDVLVTHAPTVTSRIRERGYDQAALIARALSRGLRQPYAPVLTRQGTQRQLGQGRAVRKQQMDRAFRVVDPAKVQGRHVLLIDDVLTTGATCEAAARVLKQAGAKQVSVAVFAVA